MQQHSIRPDDRMHRSSSRMRGQAGRRPATGDATVMDIGAPAEFEELRETRTDSPNGSYDSIAVVVGKKSGGRGEPLRIPAIRSGVSGTIRSGVSGTIRSGVSE